MATSQTRDNGSSERQPIVNGVELTDLNAVRSAFAYLSKGYNNGEIYDHGEFVTLTFRDRHSEHFGALRDADSLLIRDVYARVDGRQVVEVSEQ